MKRFTFLLLLVGMCFALPGELSSKTGKNDGESNPKIGGKPNQVQLKQKNPVADNKKPHRAGDAIKGPPLVYKPKTPTKLKAKNDNGNRRGGNEQKKKKQHRPLPIGWQRSVVRKKKGAWDIPGFGPVDLGIFGKQMSNVTCAPAVGNGGPLDPISLFTTLVALPSTDCLSQAPYVFCAFRLEPLPNFYCSI